MGLIFKVVIGVFVLGGFSYSGLAIASWDGPKVSIQGNWGTGERQFGLNEGSLDAPDGFPKEFTVFSDGKILVDDKWNSCVKLFDRNGEFVKKIDTPFIGFYAVDLNLVFAGRLYSESSPYGVGVYDIDKESWVWIDDVAQVSTLDELSVYVDSSNREIYIWDGFNKGAKYSFENGLVEILNSIPEMFGMRLGYRKSSDGNYTTKVKFGNEIYSWNGADPFDKYISDGINDFFTYGYTDNIGDEYLHLKVQKISVCGKVMSNVDFPADGDFVYYQRPVIADNGDVYIWKRTPDTYSILKWQWVDDPNDPQPGPDAPTNLKLTPSLDGLYLTWDASPQDPGCVDSYELERATSADGVYTSVSTTDPGVLKFNDTGALPGSSYYYKVRAKSGGLYSPYSPVVSGAR